MNPLYNRKLQSAIIEIGKEVESIEETPTLADMEERFGWLKEAIDKNDMKMMRMYGRHISAMVIKFMVDKL